VSRRVRGLLASSRTLPFSPPYPARSDGGERSQGRSREAGDESRPLTLSVPSRKSGNRGETSRRAEVLRKERANLRSREIARERREGIKAEVMTAGLKV
jgi:hypothetical protein